MRRQGRTSQREVTKSISTKSRQRKSSGCVLKVSKGIGLPREACIVVSESGLVASRGDISRYRNQQRA